MGKLNEKNVQTHNGPVSGYQINAYTDYNGNVKGECNIKAFLGIPYAKPPIGKRRFKRPEPVEDWKETKKCIGHSAAMQYDFYEMWNYDATHIGISEDCLYLDIWTPAEYSEEKLPVMVWVHGGAYQTGSALLPFYNPVNIARKGVIVVNIEYRVGVFGFLSNTLLSEECEDGVSGNYGLYDVLEALKWIQKNIDAFGGDADCITVFGQSCAGDIMTYLLTSKLAEGLVKNLIIESGTGAPTIPYSQKEAQRRGDELLRQMNVNTVEELREADGTSILNTAKKLIDEKGYMWLPVVDGIFLEDQVFYLMEKGQINDFQVIISTTEHDSKLPPNVIIRNEQEYHDFLVSWIGKNADLVEKEYPFQTDWTEYEAATKIREVYSEYWTDTRARYYGGLIEKYKGEGKAYVCQWGRVPEGWRQMNDGACHAMELLYLYDNMWVGFPNPKWVEWDTALSDMIQDYWIQFAKTGNPNRAGLPEWHTYSDKSKEYLHFGNNRVAMRKVNPTLQSIYIEKFEELYKNWQETSYCFST